MKSWHKQPPPHFYVYLTVVSRRPRSLSPSLPALYPLPSSASLYPCIDSLWRWHSPPSGSSGSSRCWPGDEAVAAAGEEGTDKAAATHEEACLAGDEGSSDGSDEGCAAEPKVADGSSETAALEPPAVGGPANAAVGGRGGSAAGVDAEGLLGNTVLLSLSGGLKDLMVHPSLCVADGLGLEGQSVSFTTDVMDGCGFGVDHLALVWCKQVVGRWVMRALRATQSINPWLPLLFSTCCAPVLTGDARQRCGAS